MKKKEKRELKETLKFALGTFLIGYTNQMIDEVFDGELEPKKLNKEVDKFLGRKKKEG